MGLRIEGLRKSYGEQQVLCGVDLAARPGEVVGLLGPNGAGKTTLTSIVAGLRRADGGRVDVCGVDALADPVAARANLGLAPQELGIYPQLPVSANLEYHARLAGLSRAALRRRTAQVAGALGLTELLDRRAGVLSGGQQRRLHTAMALVHSPRVLFLDEPTVGADVATRQQLLAVVRALADEGAAVVYCTHYLPEIEALEARVTVLDQGRVVAEGSVADLVRIHTRPALELTFDGPAPADLPGERHRAGPGTVVVEAVDPGAALAALLPALGDAVHRLRSVEVRRPSLELAYLALTGHRGTGPEEARDAAA